MRMRNEREVLRRWRWTALLSVLMFFSVCWILADTFLAITAKEESVVIEIPQLCGMAEDEIERDVRLIFRTEYRYDDTAARGVVIAQSPRAGVKKKIRSDGGQVEILLTVSLGKESHTLPDFFGKDARNAEAWLRERGIQVEIRSMLDEERRGQVVKTEPRQGTKLVSDDRVILFVAVGKRPVTVQVPDLHGLSRAEALLLLAAEGLSLGEIIEADSLEESGTVIAQSHLCGTSVRGGTAISITVAREREE